MRIVSVVVTYNRKVMLEECLRALLNQTTRIHKIYVIDNNSADGTRDYLQSRGILSDERVCYERLSSNTGGAGGFSYGLSKANSEGYDWVWLMDDDVEPYVNALTELLKYSNIATCIHGLRTEPDGSVLEWGGDFDPDRIAVRRLDHPNWTEGDNSFVEVSVGCFEGMLIKNDLVQRIGLPLSDLFITWDDTYYGYLAAKNGRNIYVNVKSLRRKRAVDESTGVMWGRRVSLSSFANYYHHRNRFIISNDVGYRGYLFWVETFFSLLKSSAKDLVIFRDLGRVAASWKGVFDGLSC